MATQIAPDAHFVKNVKKAFVVVPARENASCGQKAKVLPGSDSGAGCITGARLPTETGARRDVRGVLVLTTSVWGLLPFNAVIISARTKNAT